MNKIERLIKEKCPNGVVYKQLSEISKIETGKLNANAAVENGKYNFYTTAKEISKINEYQWDTEALLIAGNANVGDVKHYVGKFNAYQRTYVLTNFSSLLLVKFLYYILVNNLQKYLEDKSNKAAMTYIVISTLNNFKVPIPPLEIQEEIVKILDKFSELEAEPEAELELRIKQYEFWREKLVVDLNGKIIKLEDLFDFKNGINKGKEQFGHGTKIINYLDVYNNNKLYSNYIKGLVNSTESDYKRYSCKRGDVFFTRTSETREEVGLSSVLVEDIEKGVFSGFLLRGRPITELLYPEYCAYCFRTNDFRDQIVRYSNFTTRSTITGQILRKTKISIPSLEKQKEIVNILDKFDNLINNISEGLPAEIELRRKQYEYYRNKLLTFDELKTN